MKFDIFFSICQTEVDGYLPTEKTLFQNFFDQVKLADELGFETAWVAESHLSSEVQKSNPGAVIPHFKGEIGLNANLLQLAQKVFSQTKRIHVGSAIMNILCNGGPLAHAEAIKMFLSLHGLDENESRLLEIGFAAGRFPYSIAPYGIKPRTPVEKAAWPIIKGLVFREATEIFLRALNNEVIASSDITPKVITQEHCRTEQHWQQIVQAYQTLNHTQEVPSEISIAPFWEFDKVGVMPFDYRQDLLRLTVGSHELPVQKLANSIRPCGVFNLSITPSEHIEKTHEAMSKVYHPDGGPWRRDLLPRTALIFVNGDKDKTPGQQSAQAKLAAEKALKTYWMAMDGTIDNAKIQEAVNNAIAGNPEEVAALMRENFHPDDRLMLWFDFNNHNNEDVKNSMTTFMRDVAPLLTSASPA
ncbi:LLM class flavin-dependent oxidoreductase [Alteromonas sp. a30]|uniref:LLM class flavin-dependent oxidoreductase n=1 Tax=Alteromonas sp. a30 TaxID=2730917 RepID=UPI00227E2B0B|nr:LLM class flavin-dependent oxidoreductase [Alteromonas sp. a30]MCY7295944.1 LLM class flavin-dependent oxidoreductase [Alteromonas sp. a30]